MPAIMYRIICKDCPANYNGKKAGKTLRSRLHKHECVIRRQEVDYQLWMHMVEVYHQVNFSESYAIAQGSS